MLTGGRGKGEAFKQAIAKPAPLGPESNPWFWNPGRVGIKFAPDWFQAKLRAIDPELSACWNPIIERWQVFQRKDRIQNALCQGWMLLFVVQDSSKAYLPLDERVFARLYNASARMWGNAKEYFYAIEREMERDAAATKQAQTQDAIDRAMPSFDHSKISVGYGKSNGSKFADYHS